jgi:alkanesulfonate monooxygenase SsuD/methylene tetrahydromethanopterin reductase-like flavin-dependent oxidoreductase (luciferase family)
VLGLAPGAREDDFTVSGADYHARGRMFDRQLEQLPRFWKGEGNVGPAPASGERPALLIGGQAGAAFRRAARYADGWTMGGAPPDALPAALAKLRSAWEAEGRDVEPRVVALFYFVLGDGAEEAARHSIGDYYAYLGEYADRVVARVAKDADTVRRYLAAYEEAGATEVICFPASPDPAQVELLAAAALP